MNLNREWATPLTMGAFFLMAVTGGLMFFHLEPGIAKDLHEWLGWLFIAGVALHVAVNFAGFRRHFLQGPGRWIVAGFVALTLGGMLAPAEEEEGGNPARLAAEAVLKAPLGQVAALTGKDVAALKGALEANGFTVTDAGQTLGAIAGDDRERRMRALQAALAPR